MKGFRLTAFWQALLVLVVAYLIFDNAFPPLLPRTLMIQFMVITLVGVLLYFSSDDERWEEFKAPILSTLRTRAMWPVRWFFVLAIPGLAGFTVYQNLKPSFDAPVELRQVHPAPPSTLKVYGKSYNLSTLENPVRQEVLERLKTEPAEARALYNEAVTTGRDSYFQNCFFCHGDQLNGDGPFAEAFNPRPINFQDVGTIAQLQEAYLFWRITTGGPGLPKEGAPWNSAMPVWHEMLSEEEVWSIITFLYDYVGQVPRMWNQETSKVVTGMKDEILAERADFTPEEIYQFRCAACHGKEGAGDGPAAEFLYPRPRDFTTGVIKYKTSPGSELPRDQDIFNTIKHGLDETGMPEWGSILSDDQIRGLIPVIKGFDMSITWAPEEAEDTLFDDEDRYLGDDFVSNTNIEPVEGQIAYSPESVARGRVVFESVCSECHGNTGRGNIISGKRLEDEWEQRIWPRDLTKPWSWRVTNDNSKSEQSRAETIRRIYQRLTIGIPGTPMPSHRAEEEGEEDPVSFDDRWHLSNFVYSLRESEAAIAESPVVRGYQVEGALPESADAEVWALAPVTTIRLAPNIIKEERLFTPLNDAVSVRTLYNQSEIAFLVEIDDRTESRPGLEYFEALQDERWTMTPDAVAIQFPKAGAFTTAPVVEKPLFRHGDSKRGTTIWYWSAGHASAEKGPKTLVMEGSGPDNELVRRKGELAVGASGAWQDGRWRVLFHRPRQATASSSDISFNEGEYIPISFSNWDGSNGEAGGKHTLTSWAWLLLPPKHDPLRVYGVPAGVGFLIFLLALAVVRRQRNRGE